MCQRPRSRLDWPLSVRTARVIKNPLRAGITAGSRLITLDRRMGISRMVVNMGITLLSSGIM